MKSCPTCHRTYPDDTLAFCLVDGSILSAPYSPQAPLPGQRRPEAEPTQVLPFKPADTSPSRPLQPTLNSPRFTYPDNAARTQPPKRGSGLWLAGGIVAGLFLIAGLAVVVIVLVSTNPQSSGTNSQNENRLPIHKPSETPRPLDSPEKDPAPRLDVAGTWTGISDLSSATLVINRSDGDSYDGTEIVSGGGASAEIAFSVKVNPESRQIRIDETRVIKGAGWNLGNNTGSISKDGQKMSGTAKDSKGRVYSWSFTRK